MLFLLLSWLLTGIIVGLLASGAKLRPASWQRWGWLKLIIVATLSAFCGGWLGIVILGKEFSLPTALWLAILAVAFVPRLIARLFTKQPRAMRAG